MTPWRGSAACRGMDFDAVFYVRPWDETRQHHKIADAKAVCAGCPVRSECLEEAIRYDEGQFTYPAIAGGMTPRERHALPRPIDHGTYAGFQQHRARGIPMCHDCRQARDEYQARQWGRTA